METGKKTSFLLVAIAVTLLLGIVVLIFMFRADYAGPGDNFRLEAAKLLLQFLLVGIGGTLALAYINQRRDQAEKVAAAIAVAEEKAAAQEAIREKSIADARVAAQERAAARRAALQELLGQLRGAHRRLKVVKRQLRAAVAREEPDPQDPPTRPYRVPAASFERAMEALLIAQISAEEVRDRIAMSIELFDMKQIERIRAALHYGVRYFHDVYEDYEHCRIKRDGDYFVITPVCNNIQNFLFARALPTDLPDADGAELQAQFAIMHEECRDPEQRHRALMKIEDLRQRDPHKKRRFRTIAAECFSLATDELRLALWRTCPGDAAAAEGIAAST